MKYLLILLVVFFVGCGDTMEIRVTDDRISCPSPYDSLDLFASDGAICRKWGHKFNNFTDKCDICEIKYGDMVSPRKAIKIRDGDMVVNDANLQSVCREIWGE